MKQTNLPINRKTLLWIGAVFLLAVGFFVGSCVKEREQAQNRLHRCCTLISFAVDKAENEDLSDPETMKALISNVYAAYEFCDEPVSAGQLHALWNFLIFENEDDPKEIILNELNAVLRSINPSDS